MLYIVLGYLVGALLFLQIVMVPLFTNKNRVFEALSPGDYEEWQKAPGPIKTTVMILVSLLWPVLTAYMMIASLRRL